MPPREGPPPVPIEGLYRLLRERFGHQGWWPAETPLEVCVGAILVQNTAWTGAERAISRLKRAGALRSARALHAVPVSALEQWIRPAGIFRVKAHRLRQFLDHLLTRHGGSVDDALRGPPGVVRERLLSIPGIGPETADCMLLYAGGQSRFVVDAYARRIFRRHGWMDTGMNDDVLRLRCESAAARLNLRNPVDFWQDLHAQLVAVGKVHCRSRLADCTDCPLRPLLPLGGHPIVDERPPKRIKRSGGRTR
ncbi:MAG: endonuclease III domain-containing protein [Verrucomicrobiae bacterium]|nr:endonuclease III domain-containing protein [Verrucomicrobiae bacterium]